MCLRQREKIQEILPAEIGGGPASQPVQQNAATAVRQHIPAAITRADTAQLTGLFDAGRYGEMESRARLMLEGYPDSGFIWKTLGQALQRRGKDNLQGLQKARCAPAG